MKYECKAKNSPDKKHKWEFHTPATWTANGPKPTYLLCEYCHSLITAPELMEIEGIKNQTRTTWILIITTIIAFLGLIISVISLFANKK